MRVGGLRWKLMDVCEPYLIDEVCVLHRVNVRAREGVATDQIVVLHIPPAGKVNKKG